MSNDLALALNKLGLQYLSEKHHKLAEQFFKEAILQDSSYADAYGNLGVTHFLNHKNDEAIDAFNKSLLLRPNHAETLFNFAYALWRNGDFENARIALEEAVLISDIPDIHFALGSLCFELGDDNSALMYTTKALERDPNNILAHDTLGEIYYYQGNKAKCLEHCDETIRIAPNNPFHTNRRALILLTFDDPDGWEKYEIRYDSSDDDFSEASRLDAKLYAALYKKRWKGHRTGHLMIHREQGFGDNIQMLQFLPLVAERCEKVSLFLPPALQRMAHLALGQYRNIDICKEMPNSFDHWCLIMSLPYCLGMEDNFLKTPYLFAPKAKYGEVSRLPGLKVGLAWTSDSNHRAKRWRNISLDMLSKLFDLPVNFVSLQHPLNEDISKYPIISMFIQFRLHSTER